MIEIIRISKAYQKPSGKKVLFSDFSLTLPDTGITALTGANGSGKTTLLRMLAGLEQPDAGQILLPEPCRVSVVFQDYRLLPALSIRKNIRLVLPKNRWADADRWLETVGLLQNADDLPGALSGGMQQRAAIARALACDHELLLLDEPFAALDGDWRRRMLDAVLQQSRHVCVVLTTHDPEDLAYLGCDSIRLG